MSGMVQFPIIVESLTMNLLWIGYWPSKRTSMKKCFAKKSSGGERLLEAQEKGCGASPNGRYYETKRTANRYNTGPYGRQFSNRMNSLSISLLWTTPQRSATAWSHFNVNDCWSCKSVEDTVFSSTSGLSRTRFAREEQARERFSAYFSYSRFPSC